MPSCASTARLSGAFAPGACIGPFWPTWTTPARTRTVPTRAALSATRRTGSIQDDLAVLAAIMLIAIPSRNLVGPWARDCRAALPHRPAISLFTLRRAVPARFEIVEVRPSGDGAVTGRGGRSGEGAENGPVDG